MWYGSQEKIQKKIITNAQYEYGHDLRITITEDGKYEEKIEE